MNLSDIMNSAARDVKAAEDYNKGKLPGIRPSRAGLTLIQLVMADIIFPKLTTLPEPKWKAKADPYVGSMRLLTGHLFEKVVQNRLEADYFGTSTQVLTQQELTLDSITGSCDIMLRDDERKKIQVIECKALKAHTVDEVKKHKLYCDNYGYLTQLAIYTLAAKEKYPTYDVSAAWYVWIKQLEKHTKVPFPLEITELTELRTEVNLKVQEYQEFRQEFDEGNLESATSKLIERTEDLPLKVWSGGYLKGSCDMHFNPYSRLLLQEDGTLLDNCEPNLLLLIRAAKEGYESQAAIQVQTLINLIGA